LATYGYVYDLLGQNVAQEGSVHFTANGPLVGITHTTILNNTDVVVGSSGTYAVFFNVTGQQQSQFALFVNGTPVPESLYASGSGNTGPAGQVILDLNAGDVLTLRNHTSSSSSIALNNGVGGSQTNVDASLLIEKLA